MLEHHEALLRAAARDSIIRIRRDHKRAPKKVKPLLVAIEAHLFDPQITVGAMLSECKIRDKGVPTLFHKELRKPPWKYTCRRRLETAAKLLRDTSLLVWQIAELVGYRDERSLNRAFKKRYEKCPRDYRRRARLEAAGIEVGAKEPTREDLQRALDGELEWSKARALLRGLQKIYRLRSPKTRHAEQLTAERIWQQVRDLPLPDQQRIVRAQIGFTTPALFHLLRENSRVIGRDDRKHGVQLAELALDALEACRSALGEEVNNLEALGWAWVANARRLALDLPGADDAFEKAEEAFGVERAKTDRLVEGEIANLKATLRMNQRRFDEALELVDRGISIFSEAGDWRSLAKSYTIRASINCYSGATEAAKTDLRSALPLLDAVKSKVLTNIVRRNLAGILAMSGDFEEAARVLPDEDALPGHLSKPVYRHQVEWTRGLIAHGRRQTALAAGLLRKAWIGFIKLGERDHAAVVALDLLATLSTEQQRPSA